MKRILFTVKLADNFALIILEQMREILIEEYLNISISKRNFIASFKSYTL